MKEINGKSKPGKARFGIVHTDWNEAVVDSLLEEALRCLKENGIDEDAVTVVRVPGAFEIPLALSKLAESGEYDALVALGAVIRGETPHFDFVASSCTSGVETVMLEHGIPVGFGVLTTDNLEQALKRAGDGNTNKGYEATLAAIHMLNVCRQI